MNRSEILFVTYAGLWLLALAWAYWMTVRAPSVRRAFRAFPAAVTPAWIVTCAVAYHYGGRVLVAQVFGIAVVSLVLLWVMQFGVSPESYPVDDEYEEGRVGVALDFSLPAQVALIIGLFMFAGLFLWVNWPR